MEADLRQRYLEEMKQLGMHKLALAQVRLFGAADGTEICDPAVIESEERLFLEAWSGNMETRGFLPLEYLMELFGCGRFERHCVMMVLCYELDPDFSRCFGELRQEGEADCLTPWLAALTWQGTVSDVELYRTFQEGSVLMKVFFEERHGNGPRMRKALCLNRRMHSFLLWDLEKNEVLSPFLSRYLPQEENTCLTLWQPDLAALVGKGKTLVELYGEKGVGKVFCILHYCRKKEKTSYLIHVDELVRLQGAANSFEIAKECLLFQAVPMLSIPQGCEGEGMLSIVRDVTAALFEVSDLVFVTSTKRLPEGLAGDGIERLSLEVRDMGLMEKREVWKREGTAYAVEPDIRLEDMANLFKLTYGGIKEALHFAGQDAKCRKKEAIDREALKHGCYSMFEQGAVKRAVRIPAVFSWDDLVLPESQKEELLTACKQVRFKHEVYENWGFFQKTAYGRGIGMIFSGAPGTGKTMAAQVFAKELGIDLYKVELSAVVSKFVGETEKNLNEIFEQAKKSQIVLFFDEADVLFSKRTEVKDSNDKYSNMEAAFLLQKMEEYEGVTILATNLIQNFDEAFKRRVKFVIDFPFPDRYNRRLLWEKAMPVQMPREELDLEYLSGTFELSGSNIKNIVLHAAFLAASQSGRVNMGHIMDGIRTEYAKSGKVLTKEDVGEYYVLLSSQRVGRAESS